MPTLRQDYASLLDDNQRLRVQLQIADTARRRMEAMIAGLQSRVQQAEAAAVQKEAQWMAEYDRNVQALLQIIKHQEEERGQLKKEIEQLKEKVAVPVVEIAMVARSTQTEMQRPPKGLQRPNSVRFENHSQSEREEIVRRREKAFRKLTHMQWLFEQLQVSKDQCECSVVNRHNMSSKNDIASSTCENCLQSRCDFKTSIIERLEASKAETSLEQQGYLGVVKDNDEKSPKEAAASVSKQRDAAITLQHDLEERNRLLQERLTSQQQVLDQLLQAKLQHANGDLLGHLANNSMDNSSPTTSAPMKGEHQKEPDHPLPMTAGRSSAERIPNPATTTRRPLSPPAA